MITTILAPGREPCCISSSSSKRPRKSGLFIGQGALAREDGDAVLAFAAQAAQKHGGVGGDWNGLSILHTAAARVGALDIGFVPGGGGMRAHDFVKAGALDLISTSAPMKSTSRQERSSSTSGPHGDRGAHRADVILPGAAYTEKAGLFVNTEGRVQAASRAAFPPGLTPARIGRFCERFPARWAIPCPSKLLTQLRKALFQKHPHLQRLDAIERGDAASVSKLAQHSSVASEGRFRIERLRFLSPTNPIARALAVMAVCSVLAKGRLSQAARQGQKPELSLRSHFGC